MVETPETVVPDDDHAHDLDLGVFDGVHLHGDRRDLPDDLQDGGRHCRQHSAGNPQRFGVEHDHLGADGGHVHGLVPALSRTHPRALRWSLRRREDREVLHHHACVRVAARGGGRRDLRAGVSLRQLPRRAQF